MKNDGLTLNYKENFIRVVKEYIDFYKYKNRSVSPFDTLVFFRDWGVNFESKYGNIFSECTAMEAILCDVNKALDQEIDCNVPMVMAEGLFNLFEINVLGFYIDRCTMSLKITRNVCS